MKTICSKFSNIVDIKAMYKTTHLSGNVLNLKGYFCPYSIKNFQKCLLNAICTYYLDTTIQIQNNISL